jgi:hypothetical protein
MTSRREIGEIMSIARVVVLTATIAAVAFVAVADLRRAQFVLVNSAGVGVPAAWLTPLGLVKGAGAAGLLAGLLGVPIVGEAAAFGLVAFFVGAVLAHLRARNLALQFPLLYLVLSAASAVVLLEM